MVLQPEADEFNGIRMRCDEFGDLLLGKVRTVSALVADALAS